MSAIVSVSFYSLKYEIFEEHSRYSDSYRVALTTLEFPGVFAQVVHQFDVVRYPDTPNIFGIHKYPHHGEVEYFQLPQGVFTVADPGMDQGGCTSNSFTATLNFRRHFEARLNFNQTRTCLVLLIWRR